MKHSSKLIWLVLLGMTLAHGMGSKDEHNKSDGEGGSVKPGDVNDDNVGSWRNVALGFGLVQFGAALSTLGAMVLYLDNIIKKLFPVGQNFSLAESKPFLASSLSFAAGVLSVTIFFNLLPEGISSFGTSNLFGAYSGLAAALYFTLCMTSVIALKTYSRKKRGGGHGHGHGHHHQEQHQHNVIIKEGEFTDAIAEEGRGTSTEKSDNIGEAKTITGDEINADEEEGEASGAHHHHHHVMSSEENERVKRLGYEIAFAIALHNFPEGVVTFVASYKSLKGGLLFGMALALHKFPEGIMIGVPIYAGTGSKWKAAAITAAASFITQTLGALFAFLLFKVYWNDIVAGLLFLLAGSILINTLFGDMLPLARSYDREDKYSTPWLVAGITIFVFLTSVIKM